MLKSGKSTTSYPNRGTSLWLTNSGRFAEILAGIREEERVTEGLTWKECLLPVNRYRFIVVVTLQIGIV